MSKITDTLKEAKRLYKLGFAIIWLHPKSKRPIESGWTTGPRKPWEYLNETYIDGLNVGVRLGSPSRMGGKGYLAVIDVDVKSTDKRHRLEALEAARRVLGSGVQAPEVSSGRGNDSRHFYVFTKEPFRTFNPAQSVDEVKVHMPSKKPSKREILELTQEEIISGIRLSHAWEVSLYSDGRQVVLPPSIHPDSGKPYLWKQHLTGVSDLPELDVMSLIIESSANEVVDDMKMKRLTGESRMDQGSRAEGSQASERSADATLKDFKVEEVELSWLPISGKVRDGIVDGKDVADRSGFLLQASTALISAGLSQNEVLSVLTDPKTYLGAVGYDHAKTKDRGRAAAWVYRYTLAKVTAERSAEKVFGRAADVVEGRELTPEEMETQELEFKEMRHWTQDLIRDAKGIPKSLIGNVVLILKNVVDPAVVIRDDFAFRDAYSCDTPWGGKKDAIVSDDDVANIKYWLGGHWGFEPKKDVVYDALTVIACQNIYDPIKCMLENLPAWDKTPRLDTWLKKNFQAKGDSEYLAQVFRKWMVAMVMRAYQPGAKFDWMPIFEGEQGVGKSSFGRLLVGDKHFLDWLPNLNDKDSALSLQGMWGVEMGELSQFRKNELENIKAFITRTVDKLRPPYGRKLQEHARRCVFFGTTNRKTYLIDDTGNRRFKPLVVGALDFKALKRDRDQLFAEAKYLFDTKQETERSLELTGLAKIYELQIHGEKMVEDDSNLMIEAMQIFLEKMAKNKTLFFDFEKFKMIDLFSEDRSPSRPLHQWVMNHRNAQYAGKMLKKMGAVKVEGRMGNFWSIPDLAKKYRKVDRSEGVPIHHDFM